MHNFCRNCRNLRFLRKSAERVHTFCRNLRFLRKGALQHKVRVNMQFTLTLCCDTLQHKVRVNMQFTLTLCCDNLSAEIKSAKNLRFLQKGVPFPQKSNIYAEILDFYNLCREGAHFLQKFKASVIYAEL